MDSLGIEHTFPTHILHECIRIHHCALCVVATTVFAILHTRTYLVDTANTVYAEPLSRIVAIPGVVGVHLMAPGRRGGVTTAVGHLRERYSRLHVQQG